MRNVLISYIPILLVSLLKLGTEATPLTTSNDDYQYKVVCYLNNTEWDSNKVDENLCTHVVYTYVAELDGKTLLIKPEHISTEFKKKIIAIKNKGIKVLTAIGKWENKDYDKYKRLVSNPQVVEEFVSNAVSFLTNSGFDGLEIQWQNYLWPEWPRWIDSESIQKGFVNLIQKLHIAFKEKGLLLSAYIPPQNDRYKDIYEVPTISKYLDWISIMFYYRIPGLSPAYEGMTYAGYKDDMKFSLRDWPEKGVDKRKLLIAMRLYGYSYELIDKEKSKDAGTVSYPQICQDVMNKGYEVLRDNRFDTGSQAQLGDNLIWFNDALTLKQRAERIKSQDLGGAALWSLDSDDFDNICGCEKYELTKAVNRAIRDNVGPDPGCNLDFVNNVQN